MSLFKQKIDKTNKCGGSLRRQKSSLQETASYFRSGQTLSRERSLGVRQETSLRELAAHRRSLTGMLLSVLAIAVLLLLLIWQLIWSVEIEATDQNLSLNDLSCYQSAFDKYFHKRPLERLHFLLQKDNLIADVQLSCPELATISKIKLQFWRPTQISLGFKRAVAMWSVKNQAYYVDDRGATFTVNYYGDPLIKVQDKSGVDPKEVSVIASSQLLGFIGRVVTLSAERRLVVEQIIIPPMATRQVEIYYQGYTYPVRMLTSGNVAQQVEDVVRSFAYFKSRGFQPKYLDVRVARRAFYQ